MQFPLVVAALLLVLALHTACADLEGPWQPFYEKGAWDVDATAWIGDGTRSELTDDGLLVADESTENGSGRSYMLNWEADAAKGAAIEARVKAISCSSPWGVCMMAADGVHEEAVTIYPDRLLLSHCGLSAPFDAAGDFHTIRLEVKGDDVKIYADDKLVIDGTGKYTKPAHANRNQCSFGAAASTATGTAVWQWVRYQAGKRERSGPAMPDNPTVEGLDVTVGETVEIMPGAIYRSLFKFGDGRLGVGSQWSSDNGKTWAKGPHSVGTGMVECADGEIIGLGFATKKVSDGVFSIGLTRSDDGGKTFRSETAIMNIPEGTGGTGDDGSAFEGPVADHAIIEADDGSLIAAMYGYFKTDTVLCPSFPPEWKMYKYRTFVVRSTDRGKNWDLLSTVAYNPEIGLESFCEADLLKMPDGEIHCFMRTGGSGGSTKFTPLYLASSRDNGKTWSEPRPIADRGVWPNACRMADGTLVVTYGRPDNWLAFSLDDGKTWTGHFCFHRGASTSYNSVEEVSPGTLLVVYDRRALAPDGNNQAGVVGTFFTVKRR